jgi:ribosomal protein L11
MNRLPLLVLLLLTACQAAPAPPPAPVVTAPQVNAQPVCQGMQPMAYWSDGATYAVKQCCPMGDGATWQCWDIP